MKTPEVRQTEDISYGLAANLQVYNITPRLLRVDNSHDKAQ